MNFMSKIKNTRLSCGAIAILLHWIAALVLIANYILIFYREWFVDEPIESVARIPDYAHCNRYVRACLCDLENNLAVHDRAAG